MNKLFSIAGLAIALAAMPAVAHEDHGKAMHGGIVAEAGHAQFEIVAAGDRLTVHVTNHGAPVATAGASGKLTALAGSSKNEIALQPAGDNRLAGQGMLAPGAKLLLSVQWPGQKPLQARAVVK
ncbi:MAG: hypothetical protein F9K30_17230 [Dechloromonas sp.]|nr:MAG: hypothetical protein F9K30_17230 [Dechloromonas sp.]